MRTVLESANGEQVVLLAQSLGARVTSNAKQNSLPKTKAIPAQVIQDTFDALPPSWESNVLTIFGVASVLWFVVGAVKGQTIDVASVKLD